MFEEVALDHLSDLRILLLFSAKKFRKKWKIVADLSGAPVRFDALDALRGFAALAIAAGHVGLLPWESAFYLAVDFFLILSGFVLAHSYFDRKLIATHDFIARRFLRMYPLHLITFLAFIFVYSVIGIEINWADAVRHFFFVHNIGFGPEEATFNIPSWTISVEFWVNVIVFLLMILIRNRWFQNFFLVALAFSVYAVIAIKFGNLDVVTFDILGFANIGLMRCAAGFGIGVLIYRASHRATTMRGHFGVQLIAAIAFAVPIVFFSRTGMLQFISPALFAFTIWVLSENSGPLAQRLSSLKRLGDISFALYITHWGILLLINALYPDLLMNIVLQIISLCIFLIVAEGTHRFLEIPLYRGGLAATRDWRIKPMLT